MSCNSCFMYKDMCSSLRCSSINSMAPQGCVSDLRPLVEKVSWIRTASWIVKNVCTASASETCTKHMTWPRRTWRVAGPDCFLGMLPRALQEFDLPDFVSEMAIPNTLGPNPFACFASFAFCAFSAMRFFFSFRFFSFFSFRFFLSCLPFCTRLHGIHPGVAEVWHEQRMHNLCQWALLFCTFSFSFPNCNGEQNKFKSQEIKRYQNNSAITGANFSLDCMSQHPHAFRSFAIVHFASGITGRTMIWLENFVRLWLQNSG